MTEKYFLKMIQQLRQHEHVMLYEQILSISDAEGTLVADYLRQEFEKESLHYPDGSPAYDATAALWAARTTYLAAQLILYREKEIEDVQPLFPAHTHDLSAGAILSADLCLRFLPEMIRHLRVIDSDDKLIDILETLLQAWHYSGISWSGLVTDNLDFTVIADHAALHQLYCERIIHNKHIPLATHPVFNKAISAQLGIHGQELWRDFNRTLLT